VLAQEWQRQIDSGEVPSRAALARELGVTRAHVTQMLRLLKLAPNVQQAVLALGDPIEGKQVGCTPSALCRIERQENICAGLQNSSVSTCRWAMD